MKLPCIRDIYQSPLTGYAYVTPSKVGHRLSSVSRRSAEGFTTCVRALASTWNNCWNRWMSDWLIHLIRVPPQWGTFLNLVAVGKAAFSHKFSGALTIKQAATNVYVFASYWWNSTSACKMHVVNRIFRIYFLVGVSKGQPLSCLSHGVQCVFQRMTWTFPAHLFRACAS